MARVLVTQWIDPAGQKVLEDAGMELVQHQGAAPMDPRELRETLRGCQALLSMLTDPVNEDLLSTPGLRVVSNLAVGVNNIDLEAARRLGVRVTHTPGVLTAATADLAWALILACARRVVEGDQLVRAGQFVGWHPDLLRGADLDGATLGIVGMGRIGAAVAHRARAFGMEVIHHTRDRGLPLDELLRRSDVLSLHCPLTPQTRHLIGERELRLLPPHAILINTARGPVVDEAALVRCLEEGAVSAAGLDVYEAEPEVHPGLLEREDVVLLPHLGSATRGVRRRMSVMAAEGILAVLEGREPAHSVV